MNTASQTAAALAPEGMWESDEVHLSTNAMIKIWRAVTAVVWARLFEQPSGEQTEGCCR